jgi:hypothetical protein
MDPAFEELVRRTRLADPPETEPKLKAVEVMLKAGRRRRGR